VPPRRRLPARLASLLGLTILVLALMAPSAWAGPTLTTTTPTTTAAPTSTTTLVPIGSQIAPTPNTVPFITRTTHASISPIWAKVSLAGLALVLLFLVVQTILTRSGRRGRWTL
jgi:beta-lactamase regulating signal transducer with metallopeptidase domain